MSICYAKKTISEHLKALRDSSLSSTIRAGEVIKQMPEGADIAKAHLSTVAALFLRAKDSFSAGDESLGNVFGVVAGIEIIRAAIDAAEAVESGDVEANALPTDFLDLCEKYGVSPVTLFGTAAEVLDEIIDEIEDCAAL